MVVHSNSFESFGSVFNTQHGSSSKSSVLCFIASVSAVVNEAHYFVLLHWQWYNVIIYHVHLAVWRENQWTLVNTGYLYRLMG